MATTEWLLQKGDYMISIFRYIQQGEYLLAIIAVLSRCFVVFCCLPIHELAHGLMAHLLGDDTAKREGRLSLNPFAHLNPIGTVMIFLFGIGYANPVPINPRNFKNEKGGMALTALAGPLANLLMGFVSVWGFFIFTKFTGSSSIGSAVAYFFLYSAQINVMLAVFNLFPIPPLDGSKILAAVLPDKIYYKYMMYERYIMIALMILLFTGVLDTPISFLTSKLLNFISILPNLVFHLY
ncbi:site-2 protease family protein [Eubacterium sp.]|uniref:site-2 protease family protein n=1 Tax=Eubacterium sp. TaxID=142586 RepID=UPI0025C2346E|nr:site-2 protease family protein [Eubacterium sp.]